MRQENVIRIIIAALMLIVAALSGIFLKAITLINMYVENIPQATIESMSRVEGFVWLSLIIFEALMLLLMFAVRNQKASEAKHL